MLDLANTDGYAVGGFVVAAAVGGYCQLKKYGITWDKIKFKAAVPYEIAKSIYHQDNDRVAQKINLDDTLVEYLQKLAPGEDGTIDIEKAKAVIEDCAKWNNRKILIPTYKPKK